MGAAPGRTPPGAQHPSPPAPQHRAGHQAPAPGAQQRRSRAQLPRVSRCRPPPPAVLTGPWRPGGLRGGAAAPVPSSWRCRRRRAGRRCRYSRRRRAGRRGPGVWGGSWRPPAPRTAGSRAGTSPRGAAAPRGRHVCAVIQCLHFQKASLPTGMAWPRTAAPPARPGPARARPSFCSAPLLAVPVPLRPAQHPPGIAASPAGLR